MPDLAEAGYTCMLTELSQLVTVHVAATRVKGRGLELKPGAPLLDPGRLVPGPDDGGVKSLVHVPCDRPILLADARPEGILVHGLLDQPRELLEVLVPDQRGLVLVRRDRRKEHDEEIGDKRRFQPNLNCSTGC